MNKLPTLAGLHEVTPADASAGVSVWRLELAFQKGGLNELLTRLNGEERARCLRYRQPADRIRFATTRVILRRMLAERLRIPLDEIKLDIDSFGKPRLANRDALFFNLSHSGNFALIALSAHQPVGVDIEAATTALDFNSLHASLTPAERRYCDESADEKAFFRVWSGKEAVLKAWGVGIADHLQSVSVVPVAPGHYAVSFHIAAPSIEAWQLAAPAGFVAALAVVHAA
ncbi:4'-phosphopantetheinyl transferase family protein [Rhodoferax ferrireducens]|uniref:4'-phosphopantetheinyl transferase family protein n=1 Tax=Rhodoferax ferrireducens TaxID=192843 RepID=UPI000E0D8B2A|nr:4'-phosphopantetheinyl transferase superfamily protein [Rhodoferax ferrireducens]